MRGDMIKFTFGCVFKFSFTLTIKTQLVSKYMDFDTRFIENKWYKTTPTWNSDYFEFH